MTADITDKTPGDDSRSAPQEDWVLQEVVRLINHLEGASIGITLTVPGGVITGELISLKEYFREFGLQWKQGFKAFPEAAEVLEQQWREFGDESSKQVKETHQQLFGYLHLRKATFIKSSGPIKMVPGLLWRGRIGEVSGFALGGTA